MKIRIGFVSNSSSSSFLLNINKDIPNTRFVCLSMLKDNEEDLGYGEEKEDTEKKSLEIEEKIKSIAKLMDELELDPNIGYCFNSCNYDTYIFKRGNVIYVDTCNNTQWEISEQGFDHGDGLYEDEENTDDPKAMRTGREFYHVDYNFIGKRMGYYQCKNKDCYGGDCWEIEGKTYCIRCKESKIPHCKPFDPKNALVIKSRLRSIIED